MRKHGITGSKGLGGARRLTGHAPNPGAGRGSGTGKLEKSGPNFRPVDADWFRSLRDQCAAKNIPFLFKQWAGTSQKVLDALGRELDGVVHDGYPVTA